MEHKLAEEVLASIPGGKVVFPYFKNRYGLQLLAYAAAEGRSLREMRQGRFRPLLQKPAVRQALRDRGGRGVDWNLLDSYFPPGTERYVLTFGLWGSFEDSAGWYQTSRRGYNVVVRLNFPEAHDRAYRRYIEPCGERPFEWSCHPVEREAGTTLAWSRIDIDPASGEALIEEVQSDWIRDAQDAAALALSNLVEGTLERPAWLGDARCDALQLFRYVQHVLANHRRVWDEAILAASMWLLREHLGLRSIYMHTHETGCMLKKIRGRRPPRSLYERLPRRFCFERSNASPKFLERGLRGAAGGEFWWLRL